MKPFIYLVYFSLFITAVSCKPSTSVSSEPLDVVAALSQDDSLKLTRLMRDLYRWHENTISKQDFEPEDVADNDSLFLRLKMQSHKSRMEELKSTQFFTAAFLNNYDSIFQSTNTALVGKEMEWRVGELPPFGNDADPWCNCQDAPDKYWERLTIEEVTVDGNKYGFNWTWDDDFEYQVVAIKTGENFQMDYLEGFDYDAFFNN